MKKYIYFLLSRFEFRKFSDKTGVPGINRNDLHAVKVDVPPWGEQKEIAKILSTWDKAIATTEQLLANSEQQKKALMQKLLTGKKRLPGFEGELFAHKLSEAAHIAMGSSPKSSAYNNERIGLPLLQGNADIKNRKSAPRIYSAEITKECRVGDILLSVRAPVGTVAVAEHRACIGRGICSIRAKKSVSQDYLYQWMLFYEPRWANRAQGSTFESINSADVKNLEIMLPDFQEQMAIARVLQAADQETHALSLELQCLKLEKKALMQQLLTGKRRVKVDEAEPATA